MSAESGGMVSVPIMIFSGVEGHPVATSHNDPLVVELKVASALVRKILIHTRSSADIITWECLQRLKYPGRDITPLVHPILGFGG